jgi:hypothetical protein
MGGCIDSGNAMNLKTSKLQERLRLPTQTLLARLGYLPEQVFAMKPDCSGRGCRFEHTFTNKAGKRLQILEGQIDLDIVWQRRRAAQ